MGPWGRTPGGIPPVTSAVAMRPGIARIERGFARQLGPPSTLSLGPTAPCRELAASSGVSDIFPKRAVASLVVAQGVSVPRGP